MVDAHPETTSAVSGPIATHDAHRCNGLRHENVVFNGRDGEAVCAKVVTQNDAFDAHLATTSTGPAARSIVVLYAHFGGGRSDGILATEVPVRSNMLEIKAMAI